MKITELDHIVLNVRDVDRSLAFYVDVLGLRGERIEEFKAGKVGFPSVRVNDRTLIDLNPVKGPAPRASAEEKSDANLNHFCLVAAKQDFAEMIDYLKERGIPIREGPVSRWGARGRATSIYFLDPDGNEIEIRCY
jgi:catechol 2,3-dioxygenase-like lactoylglutathione lyase family enzyme